ncbi:MAG TPA: hypothetical protein VM913_02245 [Sphingomicrobium sp.]|jgi:hypothetical protein|nr:hypothetical protein [Sphingomicrobium sp.]
MDTWLILLLIWLAPSTLLGLALLVVLNRRKGEAGEDSGSQLRREQPLGAAADPRTNIAV